MENLGVTIGLGFIFGFLLKDNLKGHGDAAGEEANEE